jgi:SRSO17 transposase
MDAGYGNDTRLRTEITALGMSYVAGIGLNTSVWPLGTVRRLRIFGQRDKLKANRSKGLERWA